MLQHRAGLLLRDPRKKLHKLRQGDAVFQVFEQGCHRDPCAAEHPGTTDALRITLHCGAASPPEFGLPAHGPIVAGLLQGRHLDDFKLPGPPSFLLRLRAAPGRPQSSRDAASGSGCGSWGRADSAALLRRREASVGLRSLGMPTWLQSLREPDFDDRLAVHTEPGGLMVEPLHHPEGDIARCQRHRRAASLIVAGRHGLQASAGRCERSDDSPHGCSRVSTPCSGSRNAEGYGAPWPC
jgi:hypothetical protein